MKRIYFLILLFLFIYPNFNAQQYKAASSSEIYHQLKQLNFIGSALYIAAHPDDENTAMISYLANGVCANTAYLAITRGDGGQNLIGSELREMLGVIRTEELLKARSIDGGHQFFTRANDFGYSKNPTETFEFWNKKEVLSDVVSIIRQFKPDIIINRFDHRSPGTTHGHHTASAMLSIEAFDIVNDSEKYPESAKEYGVWQPERVMFNHSWWFYGGKDKFDRANKSKLVKVDIGKYYTELGYSNGEIAALSRSSHKSQGFGFASSRGETVEYLEPIKGSKAEDDNLFSGINTTWTRLEGGEVISSILLPLEESFDFKNPSAILPDLLKAYSLIKQLKDKHWATIKIKQIEQLILNCQGMFLQASTSMESVNPNQEYNVDIEVIKREKGKANLFRITDLSGNELWSGNEELKDNIGFTTHFSVNSNTHIPEYSSPYYLDEKGSTGMYRAAKKFTGMPFRLPLQQLLFELQYENDITLTYPVEIINRTTDPVKGEVFKTLEVLPEATVKILNKVSIFPDDKSQDINVEVRAGKDNFSGELSLELPEGWSIQPASHKVELAKKAQTKRYVFQLTPPSNQSTGLFKASIKSEGKVFNKELNTIDYPHIPYKSVLLPAEGKIARISIEKKGTNIGYIEGAGDDVPESLRQIGYDITMMKPNEVTPGRLSQFDAVVIGIRAYNVFPEMEFVQPLLNEYAKNGGTVIAQYNTLGHLLTKELAPFSLNITHDRVTDELSEVRFLEKEHPVLNTPNKINKEDFDGWVQERGLYFPNKWGKEFVPILGMHDKGESELKGSLLIATYGKGYYVYTGLSFFRELPAGVSGAFRLFVNMLSLGK